MAWCLRFFLFLRVHKLSILALLLGASGCVYFSNFGSNQYDANPLTIQTISLFNQKVSPAAPAPSLNGDWIFRRKRLSKISMEIARAKPDILFLQQVMRKNDNPYENDILILKENLQANYQVFLRLFDDHQDTLETEYMGILVSPSLITQTTGEESDKDSTSANLRPLIFSQTVSFAGAPILLINVSLPHESIFDNVTYEIFHEKLKETMSRFSCPNRVIIAGFFPGAQFLTDYKKMLTKLHLKESHLGLCKSQESCFTKSLRNEIFLRTHNGEKEELSDLILVSQSTLIESSFRVFDQAEDAGAYFRRLGFSKVFSSRRFGWQSTLRLPKCGQNLD